MGSSPPGTMRDPRRGFYVIRVQFASNPWTYSCRAKSHEPIMSHHLRIMAMVTDSGNMTIDAGIRFPLSGGEGAEDNTNQGSLEDMRTAEARVST